MRLFLVATAALALAACTQTATQTSAVSDRDCFRNEDVNGYNVVDDHTVSISVGTRRYLMTTQWTTRDLDWGQAIALRSSTGWICTGNGLGVDIIGGEPRRTYQITGIARAPEPTPPPAPAPG